MTDIECLGAAVRWLRRCQQMTVRELANRTNLAAEIVAGFENGVITPSLTSVIDLLRALDANLMDLYVALIAVRERRSLTALESEAALAGIDQEEEVRAALIDALERAALRVLRVAGGLRSGILPISEGEFD